MTQLGEMLKAAREEQQLSLEQVEIDTHIRRHLLEALEEDNMTLFSSPVVTRGLIRNYAKYLNLDPVEALTLYDGNGIVPVKGQRLTPNGIEFMNLSMAPRPFISSDLVIGLLLFFLVLGGGGYLAYTTVLQPGFASTPTPAPRVEAITADSALLLPTVTPAPTETPTPLPPTDTPTPIIYGGVNVELVIKQPSWIQILTDDVKVFEGFLQPGESRNWTGQQRVAIRAGNAGGVEVIVNGVNRGPMGAEGQVVDQIWEKVDDPTILTPQPEQTGEVSPTETPLVQSADGETLVPLESAPESAPAPEDQDADTQGTN